MLIDKKTVSVILLILGVLFSAPSYANNAENSSDDEDSFSIINVFRNTTTYDFTVGKGEVLLYPASAVGELMISGLLDMKANSIIRQADLNKAELGEHRKKAILGTVKGLRFVASALGYHALIIFGDSAYLAFFNN